MTKTATKPRASKAPAAKPLAQARAEAEDNISLEDETFGQRVKRLRIAAGFPSSSDLARAIWGERDDGRGFMVANNRDTIWRYETDKSAPSRKNLSLLAAALGVTEKELDPAYISNRRTTDVLEVRVINRAEGRYRFVVDLEVDDIGLRMFSELNAWLKKNPDGHPAVRVVRAEDTERTSFAAPKLAKRVAKANVRGIVKGGKKAPAKKATRK